MASESKLEKEKIQLDISSLSKDIKSAAIISLIVLVIALAFTMGPAFITLLYFGVALAGVIAYTMYPEQSDDFLRGKQLHLLGASIGFFVAGPLGLLLGAWIVHFSLGKINFVGQQAQTVQNAAQTLFTPFQYIKNFLAKSQEVAADVFDALAQMQPDFTFPEDHSPENSSKNTLEEKLEIKLNNLEKTLEEEDNVLENHNGMDVLAQPTFQIQEPSRFMGWFYGNFSPLPPALPIMPIQHPIDLAEEQEKEEDTKEWASHPIDSAKP